MFEGLKSAGVRLPGDLSIVNIAAHSYESERLAFDSIRTPIEAMGREAIALLLERIEQPERASQRRLLAAEFVAGETTAPPGQVLSTKRNN